ncbi:Tetratricopeptide repeat protein 6 [Trichoplax sp. H2]|nr:Tetratricopeptide repeat protein 6 [Trichoplax sp. H2]|eukprot:RDD46126.1 Tetratricopeptide repeat protein 6 [Trichoplax sp. H2]
MDGQNFVNSSAREVSSPDEIANEMAQLGLLDSRRIELKLRREIKKQVNPPLTSRAVLSASGRIASASKDSTKLLDKKKPDVTSTKGISNETIHSYEDKVRETNTLETDNNRDLLGVLTLSSLNKNKSTEEESTKNQTFKTKPLAVINSKQENLESKQVQLSDEVSKLNVLLEGRKLEDDLGKTTKPSKKLWKSEQKFIITENVGPVVMDGSHMDSNDASKPAIVKGNKTLLAATLHQRQPSRPTVTPPIDNTSIVIHSATSTASSLTSEKKMLLRKRNSINILRQTIDFRSSSRRPRRNTATSTDVIVVDKDEFLQSVIEEEPSVTGLQEYEETEEDKNDTRQAKMEDLQVAATVIKDISKYVEDLEKLGIDLAQYRSRSTSPRSNVGSQREHTSSSISSAPTYRRKFFRHSRPISPSSKEQIEESPSQEINNAHGENRSQPFDSQDLKNPDQIGVVGMPSHMMFRYKSINSNKKYQKTKLNQNRTTMHQFCLPTSAIYLPPRFQVISQNVSGNIPANVLQKFKKQQDEDIDEDLLQDKERVTKAADRIMKDIEASYDNETEFEQLDENIDNLINQTQGLALIGKAIPREKGLSDMLFSVGPPKIQIAPETIQNQLFPQYFGATFPVLKPNNLTALTALSTSEGSESEDFEFEDLDPEDREMRLRILGRRHGSVNDISKVVEFSANVIVEDKPPAEETDQEDAIEQDEKIEESALKDGDITDSLQQLPSVNSKVKKQHPNIYPLPKVSEIKRRNSQPNPIRFEEQFLRLPTDYDSTMAEVQMQAEQIDQIRYQITDSEILEGVINSRDSPLSDQDLHDGALEELGHYTNKNWASNKNKQKKKTKKKRKKGIISAERIKKIEAFLKQSAQPLQRSQSIHQINEVDVALVRQRRKTVPSAMDVENFQAANPESNLDSYDSTKEQWEKWFDEIYPPSEIEFDFSVAPKEEENVEAESTTIKGFNIEELDPIIKDSNPQIYEAIMKEIGTLDDEIKLHNKVTAYNLSRRGALLRKIGQLLRSQEDLELAIKMEPQFLDAFWQRHLLYLLQGEDYKALDDLNFIIKINKNHARAYRARAEIFRRLGDATMAAINYTQAIRLNPDDAEAYFRRAEMYEKKNDILSALEDYAITSKLMPTKTEAIFKHGMYMFKQGSWLSAINDFSKLLAMTPYNAEARSYRGRAQAQLGNFTSALKDLSIAIHFNPDDATIFYHRGCILRRSHPKMALQDLSTSILLDDSYDNVLAYAHRGIIYASMKRWPEAVSDFEAAVKLDKTIVLAHVNLGVIYMRQKHDYTNAIRRLTSAIRIDPTYVRAYVCRAEAYCYESLIQFGLKDYTRAIHLRPDNPKYYLYRGKLLLQMGELDLAGQHIRFAFNLNQGVDLSITQQAAVYSFLGEYTESIQALNRAIRAQPVAPLYLLLGKVSMKAKLFNVAIDHFKEAVKLMTPWNVTKLIDMPREAAEAFYLIGLSYNEFKMYKHSVDALTSAIKVDPQHYQAYYHRGLTRIKLKHPRAIQDINRALAIKSNFFQAYLSRAAYFGMKGRYNKAILNCNEAIEVQPNSLRAYLYRGALKYLIKAYNFAAKDLTKAIAIDHTCVLAYFNRALCYQKLKEYHKALQDYGVVQLLDNDEDQKVLQNRSLLYFEIGDYENALLDTLLCFKENPKDVKIIHTIGRCYHHLQYYEDAIYAFNAALAIDPFFLDAYLGRGNVMMDYVTLNHNAISRRDYGKALRLSPFYLPARLNLAYSLQVDGHFKLAWNQFTIALNIDKECISALEGRAVVNLQMSNTFAALTDINQAIKIKQTAELYTNRGVIHLVSRMISTSGLEFRNDVVNAMRDYQTAIALTPTYSLAYFNAANLYFIQRRFQQALMYYDKALEFDANDESALHNRGVAKIMMKDYEGALEDFNKTIDIYPYGAHAYFNRGNLLAIMGRYGEAENDYGIALKLKPQDAIVLKRRAYVKGKQSRKEEALEDYKLAVNIQSESVIKDLLTEELTSSA